MMDSPRQINRSQIVGLQKLEVSTPTLAATVPLSLCHSFRVCPRTQTLRLIQARLRPEVVVLVRVVLWLLSTALGTFLLFGPKAVVWKLPFLCSFPRLSLQQRERCLRSWATSRLYLFRTVFKVSQPDYGRMATHTDFYTPIKVLCSLWHQAKGCAS